MTKTTIPTVTALAVVAFSLPAIAARNTFQTRDVSIRGDMSTRGANDLKLTYAGELPKTPTGWTVRTTYRAATSDGSEEFQSQSCFPQASFLMSLKGRDVNLTIAEVMTSSETGDTMTTNYQCDVITSASTETTCRSNSKSYAIKLEWGAVGPTPAPAEDFPNALNIINDTNIRQWRDANGVWQGPNVKVDEFKAVVNSYKPKQDVTKFVDANGANVQSLTTMNAAAIKELNAKFKSLETSANAAIAALSGKVSDFDSRINNASTSASEAKTKVTEAENRLNNEILSVKSKMSTLEQDTKTAKETASTAMQRTNTSNTITYATPEQVLGSENPVFVQGSTSGMLIGYWSFSASSNYYSALCGQYAAKEVLLMMRIPAVPGFVATGRCEDQKIVLTATMAGNSNFVYGPGRAWRSQAIFISHYAY